MMNVDNNRVLNIFVKRKHLIGVIEEIIIHDEDKNGLFSSIGSVDHPSFAKTRNWLAFQGYIYKEEVSVNGDRVLKPFYFNNHLLEKGEKFYCAAAWGVRFESNKRSKLRKILKRKFNATYK